MIFCHNCGSPVHDTDKFCPECGTCLQMQEKDSTNLHGYIFTNLHALSTKSGVDILTLKALIEKFISWRSRQGINYLLLDASDYNSPFDCVNECRLTPDNNWHMHQQLLSDRYSYDVDHCGSDISYLLIIGGHDIIPMPKVGEHCCEQEDQIDSDFPYSMLYGKKTEDMLLDRTLFQVPQMLYVGRVPLSTNRYEVYRDLEKFIDRTITVAQNGIPDPYMYGQVDPHWKMISSVVAEEFIKSRRIFSLPSDNEDYNYQSLALTPHVDTENISEFFNPQASFYFFNMHGSNAPQSPYFYGQAMDSRSMTSGVSPNELASTQKNNLVVTEACYGARFIGYGKEGSMLLSAIGNGNTVLYLGSSRIAFGSLDIGFCGESSLSNADLIAKIFINSMLAGYSAGQSLFLARRRVFESDGICSHTSPTTVTEFNLFGDPSLHIYGVKGSISSSKKILREPIYNNNCPIKVDARKIFGSSIMGGSILDLVRLQVDSNFRKIRQAIETHLYSMYKIRPKQLNSVYHCKSATNESYSYNYSDENNDIVVVEIDKQGNITKVLTEK